MARAGPPPDATPGVEAYVKQRFPLVPVPTVPEIRVHKAAPDSGLHRLAELGSAELAAPYWSTWWGGGIALARYVLDRPETVAGRRILDLGTGSGLVAIAAAKAGSSRVIAADTDRYAIWLARMNAGENGVDLSLRLGDPLGGEPPDVNVVLVGDLFYEARLARRATRFLQRCTDAGLSVLVGDPGREHLPRARLAHIAEFDGPEFARWQGRNAVYEFRPGRLP